VVRRIMKTALTLAATMTMVAAAAALAGPASATYKPPVFHLACGAAASGDALQGSVGVLPFGVTTPPNSYSTTVTAVGGGTTTTFAVATGSLPPGLTLPAQPGSGSDVITGNPTKAGVYNFTIKAATGPSGKTVTLAYEITITVQGAPDQLLCQLGDNGGILESGVCVLPDAIVGQPYAGHLLTSHQAGGALSVVSGSLPPGLTLPAAFTGSGDTISGTPAQPGVEPAYTFTVQGTGDQGQPLYQAYSITVDPNQPLTVVLPASGSTLEPGTVGQAYGQNFFLSGGGNPYTWSVASGQLPPGLTLQTYNDPQDVNNELAGTPTTAGTYTFTMKVADYDGQQATQKFTLAIDP
jgi:large repetitive protein